MEEQCINTFKSRIRQPGYTSRRLINIASFALVDALAILTAVLIGDLVLFYINAVAIQIRPALLLVVVWWMAAGLVRIYPGWGLGAVEELRRITISLLGMFGMVTLALFVLERAEQTSRITYLVSLVVSLGLVPLGRVLVKTILIRFKVWGVPAVIYGDRESAVRIIKALEDSRGLGYMPIGVYSDDLPRGGMLAGLPVYGDTEGFSQLASVAFVVLDGNERQEQHLRTGDILEGYKHLVLIPSLLEGPSLWVKSRDLQGILGLEITHNLLNPLARSLKRVTELTFVTLTLPLWLPLILICSGLIFVEDREYPFFLQERRGRKGELFRVLKFRTMRTDAEEYLETCLDQDQDLREEWEKHHKLKKDPRITVIGKFLRTTSLDELPQIFNIFTGDMALIGPRPLPKYHCQKLSDDANDLRHKVRPGITGLWQVSGRSEAGTRGMEKWDPYYIRNWSLWLDVVIFVRTIKVVLRGTGAY